MGVVEGLHCSGRSVFLLEETTCFDNERGKKQMGRRPIFYLKFKESYILCVQTVGKMSSNTRFFDTLWYFQSHVIHGASFMKCWLNLRSQLKMKV